MSLIKPDKINLELLTVLNRARESFTNYVLDCLFFSLETSQSLALNVNRDLGVSTSVVWAGLRLFNSSLTVTVSYLLLNIHAQQRTGRGRLAEISVNMPTWCEFLVAMWNDGRTEVKPQCCKLRRALSVHSATRQFHQDFTLTLPSIARCICSRIYLDYLE